MGRAVGGPGAPYLYFLVPFAGATTQSTGLQPDVSMWLRLPWRPERCPLGHGTRVMARQLGLRPRPWMRGERLAMLGGCGGAGLDTRWHSRTVLTLDSCSVVSSLYGGIFKTSKRPSLKQRLSGAPDPGF